MSFFKKTSAAATCPDHENHGSGAGALFSRAAGFAFRRRAQLLCILAGVILYFAAVRLQPAETDLKSGHLLPRSSYGGRTQSYEIEVEGLGAEPVPVEVPVSGRVWRDDEVGKAYEACMQLVCDSLLNGNPSPKEVRTDLTLASSVPEYGVHLSWTSSDPDIIDFNGKVRSAELPAPADVTLTAHLTAAGSDITADYVIPLTVLPRQRTAEEQLLEDFRTYLLSEDEKQAADEVLSLPTEFQGHALRYTQKTDRHLYYLLFVGPLCAILLWLREKQGVQSEEAARRRQLLLDYPEIVSKLMVFIGAGMTIRIAWENIVSDYEADGGPKRYAYEEMTRTLAQLKTGASEGKAYHEFGRSCGLRQYMKLASLLEQNRRTGIANLRTLLKAEMNAAWEERKNMARRQGEEAGTKLLGPLFLMLIIVMVVIIVPALMSF